MQYPAMHTNCTIHHSAPLYNNIIIILFDTVYLTRYLAGMEFFLNTTNSELNGVAILPLWHVSPMPGFYLASMPTSTVGNVKIAGCCLNFRFNLFVAL